MNIMFIQPKSLQQRMALFVLTPVFLILIVMGSVGFIYTRNVLLNQWGETVVARLQKAAHHIDMRLNRPKEFLMLLQDNSKADTQHLVHSLIIEQLKRMDGVVDVKVDWPKFSEEERKIATHPRMKIQGMQSTHNMDHFIVTLPVYNAELQNETISLLIEFRDHDEKKIGQIEVVVAFHDLISEIVKAPWWQSNKAFLVDDEGTVLTQTLLSSSKKYGTIKEAFGTTSILERRTLAALNNSSHGTVFGSGSPPEEISGFYRLTEAPWSLVIISPGKKALEPILKFSKYYLSIGIGFILTILLFIRVVVGRTAVAIKEVSEAADNLANGNFCKPLQVTSRDEVGELTYSFNRMTSQLQKGLYLEEAMNIAREVQQNLLPQKGYSSPELEISGVSIFCNETGGDYFDIIEINNQENNLGVVVGDVVGHGIGAALLMATTRASLRSRIRLPGTLAEILNHVNEQLYEDTKSSGSFVTLFFMNLDIDRGEISWVRAGHDPAIVYTPENDEFTELKGDGLVLGFDKDWKYKEYNHIFGLKEQVLLVGSDGAWEAENATGERFGKERVKKALALKSHLPPDQIIQFLTKEIDTFRGDTEMKDDITLVVSKIKNSFKQLSPDGIKDKGAHYV